MCKQGTYKRVVLHAKSDCSDFVVLNTVDACIASIVQALNDAGLETVASCCGHDGVCGSIILKDGRELLIAESFKEARCLETESILWRNCRKEI